MWIEELIENELNEIITVKKIPKGEVIKYGNGRNKKFILRDEADFINLMEENLRATKNNKLPKKSQTKTYILYLF